MVYIQFKTLFWKITSEFDFCEINKVWVFLILSHKMHWVKWPSLQNVNLKKPLCRRNNSQTIKNFLKKKISYYNYSLKFKVDYQCRNKNENYMNSICLRSNKKWKRNNEVDLNLYIYYLAQRETIWQPRLDQARKEWIFGKNAETTAKFNSSRVCDVKLNVY